MSKILDALKRLETERARAASPLAPLDMLRLEQFLDLQRQILLRTEHPDRLPDRIVQAVGIFIRTAGVAIGVVRDGLYRILATYGRGREYWAEDDGRSLEQSLVEPAISTGRPLVLRREMGRDLVLPFPKDCTGALHLLAPEGNPWRDDEINEARALSVLVGVALANADLCPQRH
jgi:GAF domain-containing protein